MFKVPRARSADQISVSRRRFITGAVLASASGLAFLRQPVPLYPVVAKQRFTDWVPKDIGSWRMDAASGVVLPPQDALSDRLYDNLVTRIYVSPDRPAVMMLLAYNNIQDGVLQVHRPETCYHVGGFALSNRHTGNVAIGKKAVPTSFFTATSPGRIEQVGYFTRIGSFFPSTWADQRIAVARANLGQEIPDAIMFRISLLGPDQDEAKATLSEFFDQFHNRADIGLQRLLIGRNA